MDSRGERYWPSQTGHTVAGEPMSEVSIRVRDNGPLVVEGSVTVVDARGNRFIPPAGKPNIALCRCGHSGRRPFCDGSHLRVGFSASEPAPVDESATDR